MKRALKKAHSARFALPAMALTWAAASVLQATTPPTYTAIPIGALGTDPNGIATSSADAVNSNGLIVGFSEKFNSSHTDLGPEAIIYNNGVLTDIGNLGTSGGSGNSAAIAVNAGGVVVGNSEAYNAGGTDLGGRGFIYQSGTLTSIGVLALASDGTGSSAVTAINSNNVVVGTSELFDGSGNDLGTRGVVYQSGTLTNIGNLGTDSTGFGFSNTVAINSSGLVAGTSWKFDGSGNYLGTRAVMWQSGTLTELTNLGTDSSGNTTTNVVAMNDNGTIVGTAEAFSGSTDLGSRGVFWQNNVITNIGNLGTDSTGFTNVFTNGLNAGGTIIGAAEKYTSGHTDQGLHGVVYSSGTLADIGTLGTDSNSIGSSNTVAINTSGMVIGNSEDYNGSHTDLGLRAVVWQSSTLTNLGTPLTNASGFGFSTADGLNDAGTVWGHYSAVDSSNNLTGLNLAFIWTSGNGLETADQFLAGGAAANGWASINSITGITSAGAIVGVGTRLDGSTEGFSAPLAITLLWDGATNNTWDKATGNWSNSNTNTAVFSDGVVATFDDTAPTTATSINIVATVSPLLANINSSTNNYTFSGTGSIGGSGSLAKNGASTLTITNANSYSGGTYINGGTLQLGNGGSTGSLGTGEVVVDSTLNFNLTATIANNIDGTGSIIQNSTTTTILTGTNAFSGTTTISKGGLRLGSLNAGENASIVLNLTGGLTFSTGVGSFVTGALSGTGNLALTDVNNSAVTFTTENNGSSTVYSGILSGSGNLGVSGAGTLTLIGANTYSGTTTINTGAIQVGNGGTVGNISAASVTDNGTLVYDRVDNLTVANTISGTGNLTQLTTSTLTLTGANSYQGTTTITAGTVIVGAGVNTGNGTSPLGAITGSGQGDVEVVSGATLNLGTTAGANNLNFGAKFFDIAGTGVNGVGAIVNTGNGQQNAFQEMDLAANATINATSRMDLRNSSPELFLNGFTLTKTGTGQFTLVGATVTGSNGSIVVQQGTLGIEITTSLLAGDTTSLTFDDGTLAEFFQTGTNVTSPFIMGTGGAAGTGVTMLMNNNQAVSIGSNITLDDNLNLTAAAGIGGIITLTGNISDDGNGRTVTRTSAVATQTYVLAGTDTYAGATFLNSGILQLANVGAVQSSTVTMNGGTLQFATGIGSFTAGGLSGTGNIALADVGTGAVTLTIGGNQASTTYSGALSSSGGLIKIGSGTTTLAGVNSYTGGTRINSGNISVTGSLASTGNVTVAGGTLSGISSAVGNVSMTSGTISPGTTGTPIGTLNLTSLTVSGGNLQYTLGASNTSDLIAVSGAANFSGSPTLTVGSGVAGTYTLLTSSGLSATHPTLISPTGGGVSYALDYHIPNEILLDVVSTTLQTLVWDGQADQTTWDFIKANWNNAGNMASVYANPDAVVFDDTASTTAISIALNTTVLPTSVLVNSNTNNYTISGTGAIGGTASLTKSGTSTLILATTNSYAGTTTINAGTLQIGNGGTLGSLGGGAVTDNGALSFKLSNTATIANAISGTGSLAQIGTGTTILTASNGYSGGTTISAGTLQIGNGGATGSLGSGAVTDNSILAYNVSGTTVVSNAISGSGQLQQNGPSGSTLVLTGNNNYGTTTISANTTLQISNNATNGSLGAGNVTDSGTLAFDRSDSPTVSNIIGGSGSVTQISASSGSLTLSGMNTYTGTTSITAGAVVVTNAQSLGSLTGGAVTIANGATLDLTGVSVALAAPGFGAKTYSISGFGIGNNGAIINNGTTANAVLHAFENVTLNADASIGGSNATFAGNPNSGQGRIDIGRDAASTLTLNGHTLFKSGNNFLNLATNLTVTQGNIVVNGGVLSLDTGATLTDQSSFLIFDTNTIDQYFNNTTGDVTIPTVFNGAGIQIGQANNSINSTIGSNMALNSNLLFTPQNGATNGGLILTGIISDVSASLSAQLAGNPSFPAVPAGIGSITKAGTDTITLAGANTFSGASTLNAGALQLANGNALQNSTLTMTGGSVAFSTGITGFTVGGLSGSGNIVLADMGSAAVTLSVGNNNGNTTYSGALSGSGALTKIGTGVTILAGGNTNTGVTAISAGTLQIGSGGTTGALGSGSVTDNGSLTLDRVGTVSAFMFSNNISGSGSVNQISTDITVLLGSNSYTGATNIAQGTLRIGNGGTVGSIGTGAISDSGTLAFNRTDNALVISAGISGTGALTQMASGTTTLTGTNSYGATTISAGTLQIGNGGSTGTLGNGNVTDNASLNFNRGDNPLAYVGAISGSGSVNQIGSGATTLGGTNTYSGGTTINSGLLSVTGSLLSTGNVAISGGALGGISTGVGNVTLASGAIAPGTTAIPVGTLNLTSLTVSGGTLQYTLAANNASDLIAVSGAASFTGGSTLLIGTAMLGSFVLLTSSSLTGTAPTLSGPAGFSYTELFNSASAPNDIIIEVAPPNLTWDGQADQTTWDINTTANWNDGANPAAVYAEGSSVAFDDTAPSNATTIALNTTVSPGSVMVNSTSNNYTISGTGSIGGNASLNKSGGSTLIVATNNSYTGGTTISGGIVQVGNGGGSGSLGSGPVTDNASLVFNRADAGLTVAGNISGSGTVTQMGTGTTTLTGSNTYTGTTTVLAGTLTIGATGALPTGGDVNNAGSFTVNANATAGNVSGAGITTVAAAANFSANNFSQAALANNGSTTLAGSGTVGPISGLGNLNLTGGTLVLATGSGPSTQGGLTITGGAALDINNNHLFIQFGTNPDPITTIRAYLTSGYNGGHWNGTGIISSAAQATQNSTLKYGVGYADGSDPGNPAGLPVGKIEIKYTLIGDLDLNGVVNGTDFSLLSGNFGHVAHAWDQGDLDYNNVVNGTDFSVLSANFGKSDSGAAVSLSAADWAAFDSFAENHGLAAAVPEPGAAALMLAGASSFLLRRVRRIRSS